MKTLFSFKVLQQRLITSPAWLGVMCGGLMLLSSYLGFRAGAPQQKNAQAVSAAFSNISSPPTDSRTATGLNPWPTSQDFSPETASANTGTNSSHETADVADLNRVAQGTTGAGFAAVGGPQPAAFKGSATPAARSLAAPHVSIPLVFRVVDVAALGMTAVQIAELDAMRGKFTQQVGQQNPTDPAYRARWASAQSLVDQELRAKLGWTLFNQYQIAASRMQ